MENEEKIEPVLKEVDDKKQTITMPIAIIIAGLLVMVGIILANGGGKGIAKEKTLSEQVGVNKDKFTQCLKDTDTTALREKTNQSAEAAMKGVPADQRGTPYSVVVGKNGSKAEIRGAFPKEDINKLIAEVNAGKVTVPYTGEIPAITAEDHIIGNTNAPIVIVEYSDLECPFCKRFGTTMKEIVAESNGQVAWVYRHWIVHVQPGQNALPKAAASECVTKLKGNDAFWKYIDLVFGLMKTADDVAPTDNL